MKTVLIPADVELLKLGHFTREPLHVLLEGDEQAGYRLTFRQPARRPTITGALLGNLADRLAGTLENFTACNGAEALDEPEVKECLAVLRELATGQVSPSQFNPLPTQHRST